MSPWLHRLLTLVVILVLAVLFVLWLLQFFPHRIAHPGMILPVGSIA
jgi:ABC-type transporter Mla subunit MlaD